MAWLPWLKSTPCFYFVKNRRKTRGKHAQNKNTRKTRARQFLTFPPVFRLFSACFLENKRKINP